MKTVSKKTDKAVVVTVVYFTVILIVAAMLTSCSATRSTATHYRVADCPSWAKK